MPRSARVLSATVLIGAALGAAAPLAAAESGVEVNPHSVEPGGTITISVACDPTGGPVPETIEAGSEAFEQGSVQLRRVPANDDEGEQGGPSYNGTARLAPAADLETGADASADSTEWGVDGTCPAAPGGAGKEWSGTFTVPLGGSAHHPADDQPTDPADPQADQPADLQADQPADQHTDYQADQQAVEQADQQAVEQPGQQADQQPTHPADPQADHPADQQPAHPVDPQADHPADQQPAHPVDPQADHPADQQPAHPVDPQADHQADRQPTHHPAVIPQGVHAGGGGAFTDSVPALVAGGLLIVGALGAAVHRLRRRE
ncbi:hypothetical protein SGFS_029630 [Streptomyces graminofaciens]|uniref:Uncharacterized protein n=1 Tax=Streptomyces graminofaciens TaxID=68212 RepID=A0ABN5VEA3_9ACTN|nr:hypothetical protein [Streptomyces graminofaciens]BBC31669.1 hypothetical protein SGFS_029630 [Streptomyces graminofaciens]